MSEESAVATNEIEKPLHWTQKPENKGRLIEARKAYWRKHNKGKGPVSPEILLRRAFCRTCNGIVLDKYAHRISYPKHDIDWKRHLTAKEIAKGTKAKGKSGRVVGGRNPSRSAFCETCKQPYSNKYDHFKTHPTHILKQPDGNVFGKPKNFNVKLNGHASRGVVSVLGSPVWDAAKSKSASHGFVVPPNQQFVAGFKAGYDFRAGLEDYAREQNIPIEALVGSAAQVLESEQV
jgi:hypothetical protein